MPGYGPLARRKPKAVYTDFPDAANIEWIALPAGFEYVVFGVAGDRMTDGNSTPTAHDGMAVFPVGRGGHDDLDDVVRRADAARLLPRARLVRNHENRDATGPPIGGPRRAYDPNAAGGCTTLELAFRRDGTPVLHRSFVSLNGTIVNCAGGLTPGGSWISSEETTETRAGVKHGYNFLVPASANGAVDPVPLTALGRFSHEAVAIDPATGIVYQTEDEGDSGFFRFVPRNRRDREERRFERGTLQMLKVRRVDNASLKTGQTVGRTILVDWVTIDDPDPASGDEKAVFDQGAAKGGAAFGRLEGTWYGNGAIYFTCTNGGAAGQGQVWEYRPGGGSGGFLQLVYESPGGSEVSFPDNIVVSPRGGLLLCEDHSFDRPGDPFQPLPNTSGGDVSEVQYLKGLTSRGQVFDFAANALDDKEWAGATFTADGAYLFVNTQGATSGFDPTRPQDHGRTYAIWGPWRNGPL